MIAKKNNLLARFDILLFYICIIGYITEQAMFHINGVNGKKRFIDRDAPQHFFCKIAIGGIEPFPYHSAHHQQSNIGEYTNLRCNMQIIGDHSQVRYVVDKLCKLQYRGAGIQYNFLTRTDMFPCGFGNAGLFIRIGFLLFYKGGLQGSVVCRHGSSAGFLNQSLTGQLFNIPSGGCLGYIKLTHQLL